MKRYKKHNQKSVRKKLFAYLIPRDILNIRMFLSGYITRFDTTDTKRQNRIRVEFIDKSHEYL